jgi:hypothetical protein
VFRSLSVSGETVCDDAAADGEIVDAFEKLEFVDPKGAKERFEADMMDYFVKHPPECWVKFTPRMKE